MSILQVDAGNTRIKWRVLSVAGGAAGAFGDSGLENEPDRARFSVIALMHDLREKGVPFLSQAQICSVRDAAFRAELEKALLEQFGVKARFAKSVDEIAGVRNGYTRPGALGVDRWLAVLAAKARTPGAAVVLDCGTTMTLDVVTADGQHLGGYIVPGLRLQLQALAARSEALRVAADEVRHVVEDEAFFAAVGALEEGTLRLEPGHDTFGAIGNGVLNMALGFINFQHRKVQRLLGTEADWFLCGGDAPLLAAHLEWPHTLAPDLVLDGLSLGLPE